VFFGLVFGLESSGGFDSFDFYCLVQIAIKNKSPWVPPILRCWNCHSINWMIFVSAHGRPVWSRVAETQITFERYCDSCSKEW